MLKDFLDRLKGTVNPLMTKFYNLNGKIEEILHINESYTGKALRFVYFMPDISLGIDREKLKSALIIMLCVTTAIFLAVPGYILFTIVILMYLLFASQYKGIEGKCVFTSFDILLTLFCFVVLSVATIGKDFSDIIAIFVVYSSFITFYIIVVNTADNFKILFRIKFIFCMVGAVMALVQLSQNILSYEMKVLGQIYVLSAPMDFELFFSTKNKKLKALFIAAAALTLIALTVCWSGGSWVWATFILAFFIVIKDWRLLLAGGIGLLFIPFIIPGEIIDFHTLYKTGIMNYLFAPSADYRISAFGALKGILDYYKDYPSVGKWHASVIIFICVIILLLLILREVFFGMKSGQMGMVCALLSAVGFGVTGFLFSDISTGIWQHYKTLFVFWIYTSIYAADSRLNKKTELPGEKTKTRVCFIDIIPPLLIFAYLIAAF